MPAVLEHPPVTNRAPPEGVARAIGGTVVSLDLDQAAAQDGSVGQLAAERPAEEVTAPRRAPGGDRTTPRDEHGVIRSLRVPLGAGGLPP